MATKSSQTRRKGDRYQAAAELAIEQLDWVISYLHRIRKPQLAEAIRRNRTTIVNRMRG